MAIKALLKPFAAKERKERRNELVKIFAFLAFLAFFCGCPSGHPGNPLRFSATQRSPDHRPEETPPDFLTLRPALSANVTPGGVHIPWKFDGYSKWLDVLRLEVDRSDGKGFVHLTYDTTPGYTDTHPQPTTLTQWEYRGIFGVDATTGGLWSETVTVAVGG